MGTFSSDAHDGHTHVLYGSDDASGLKAIIAVHNTALGPALGGTRFHPYASEEEALHDVLRLSRGMTYKNAAAGLDHGGGKAVIIGDPRKNKSERLFRAFGRMVDSLGGLYITAEDVGTTADDMRLIAKETRWVTGQSSADGGSGDPSPATALGLFNATQAVAEFLWGNADLGGRRVGIQGVGKVGSEYARLMAEAGAELIVADEWQPSVDRIVETLGAKVATVDEIVSIECDILSPCALGNVLNETTIPTLNCQAIVGCANNQLSTDQDAHRLADRGILYAPDFVVNAGGVINVADELHGYRAERAFHHISDIRTATTRILQAAAERAITPHEAAVILAEERINDIGELRRMHRGSHHQL